VVAKKRQKQALFLRLSVGDAITVNANLPEAHQKDGLLLKNYWRSIGT
jgi:hypothetical protein